MPHFVSLPLFCIGPSLERFLLFLALFVFLVALLIIGCTFSHGLICLDSHFLLLGLLLVLKTANDSLNELLLQV